VAATRHVGSNGECKESVQGFLINLKQGKNSPRRFVEKMEIEVRKGKQSLILLDLKEWNNGPT
jgi:hypothetical protein